MLRNVLVLSALALVVSVGSAGVQAEEMGLFAKYDWFTQYAGLDGTEDISGSRLRHDAVLDRGTVTSCNPGDRDSGRVHLNRWDGVDLGYMPELNGAHEVLLRFEDVTEIHTGGVDKAAKYQNAVLAGGGDGGWNDVWCIEMETEYRDQWEVDLTFHVSSGETGWRLSTPSLTGPTLESVRYFGSMEFRFSAAAAEGEQLAIRWNDGEWVTGGEGTALEEFPSQLPEPWRSVRLNAGNRFDEDPMRADVGTVSFYSDRANVPEPSAVVLLMFGAVMCILWRYRRALARRPSQRL